MFSSRSSKLCSEFKASRLISSCLLNKHFIGIKRQSTLCLCNFKVHQRFSIFSNKWRCRGHVKNGFCFKHISESSEIQNEFTMMLSFIRSWTKSMSMHRHINQYGYLGFQKVFNPRLVQSFIISIIIITILNNNYMFGVFCEVYRQRMNLCVVYHQVHLFSQEICTVWTHLIICCILINR